MRQDFWDAFINLPDDPFNQTQQAPEQQQPNHQFNIFSTKQCENPLHWFWSWSEHDLREAYKQSHVVINLPRWPFSSVICINWPEVNMKSYSLPPVCNWYCWKITATNLSLGGKGKCEDSNGFWFQFQKGNATTK